jgi:outer membrane protein assembly factor BamE (lipoprotein component of BamABCDE complex)
VIKKSRWDQVAKGMTLEEVKRVFGKDIWQHPGFGEQTWLVNNERDSSPNHGYMITFFKNGKVKSKGSFSISG